MELQHGLKQKHFKNAIESPDLFQKMSSTILCSLREAAYSDNESILSLKAFTVL